MRELDELFERWEERHRQTGWKRFVRDGIVDETWWGRPQSVPKVCFFLKEARTEREAGYDLTRALYEYEPWKLWQRAAIWTQAVQWGLTEARPYDDAELRRNAHRAIRQTAVVNVKKSEGLARSSEEDLRKYLAADRDLLREELERISPDVIVCGYTFEMLRDVLGAELECGHTADRMYGFWRGTLVINYYHPACRYPNRVNYYALLSICQLAKGEWEKRRAE